MGEGPPSHPGMYWRQASWQQVQRGSLTTSLGKMPSVGETPLRPASWGKPPSLRSTKASTMWMWMGWNQPPPLLCSHTCSGQRHGWNALGGIGEYKTRFGRTGSTHLGRRGLGAAVLHQTLLLVAFSRARVPAPRAARAA